MKRRKRKSISKRTEWADALRNRDEKAIDRLMTAGGRGKRSYSNMTITDGLEDIKAKSGAIPTGYETGAQPACDQMEEKREDYQQARKKHDDALQEYEKDRQWRAQFDQYLKSTSQTADNRELSAVEEGIEESGRKEPNNSEADFLGFLESVGRYNSQYHISTDTNTQGYDNIDIPEDQMEKGIVVRNLESLVKMDDTFKDMAERYGLYSEEMALSDDETEGMEEAIQLQEENSAAMEGSEPREEQEEPSAPVTIPALTKTGIVSPEPVMPPKFLSIEARDIWEALLRLEKDGFVKKSLAVIGRESGHPDAHTIHSGIRELIDAGYVRADNARSKPARYQVYVPNDAFMERNAMEASEEAEIEDVEPMTEVPEPPEATEIPNILVFPEEPQARTESFHTRAEFDRISAELAAYRFLMGTDEGKAAGAYDIRQEDNGLTGSLKSGGHFLFDLSLLDLERDPIYAIQTAYGRAALRDLGERGMYYVGAFDDETYNALVQNPPAGLRSQAAIVRIDGLNVKGFQEVF